MVESIERTISGVCSSVPGERAERDRIRGAVDEYVRREELVPPLSLAELHLHADVLLERHNVQSAHKDFMTILIGNAVWSSTMATIPYERRIFLLPQCLRSVERCQAELDEFGLLCAHCGECPIGRLQTRAEDLGYVCLVAEGTTVVTKLLASGKVDAVIGVSCLATLERTFPYLSAHAVPGIAIPLLNDGCIETRVDDDWVVEALLLRSQEEPARSVNLDALRQTVQDWFKPSQLEELFGYGMDDSEQKALAWLALDGKRWRPFLLLTVYRALNGETAEVPPKVRSAAVAVECFHKASLAHDDIEDDDDLRYGLPALHKEYGMPVALNTGDLLVGEGYRLLAGAATSPSRVAVMVRTAAEGHRLLCLGQGRELEWMRHPRALSVDSTIELLRQKTAPAFGVALELGAVCAGADEGICVLLRHFSDALGIAYQIQDDLQDFAAMRQSGDAAAARPSLLMTLIHEKAGPDQRVHLQQMWEKGQLSQNDLCFIGDLLDQTDAKDRARQYFEHYRNEAFRALARLRNADLKLFLHRITGKILSFKQYPA